MNEEDYMEQLKIAGDFHGEICGGVTVGTKMAMYGLELMGMELNQKHKNLIVFLENERCTADAIQAVTKCSMGKRSLKQMYYGKFAVTFYNVDTGEAIRITDADANKKSSCKEDIPDMIKRFKTTPPEDLFTVQKVKIKELDESQIPGNPHKTEVCSVCGEKVTDNHHVIKDGKVMCKACAEGGYYEVIDD